MEITTLLFYIVIPLAGAIAILLYFARPAIKELWHTFGRPKSGQSREATPATDLVEVAPTTKPELVLCYDSAAGTWDEVELGGNIIDGIIKTWRSLGRVWDEDGKKLHHINRYVTEGVVRYRPIEALMSETRDNPPEVIMDCFDHSSVPFVFNVHESTSLLAKLAPILWFCGIAIFILFMWATNLSK